MKFDVYYIPYYGDSAFTLLRNGFIELYMYMKMTKYIF